MPPDAPSEASSEALSAEPIGPSSEGPPRASAGDPSGAPFVASPPPPAPSLRVKAPVSAAGEDASSGASVELSVPHAATTTRPRQANEGTFRIADHLLPLGVRSGSILVARSSGTLLYAPAPMESTFQPPVIPRIATARLLLREPRLGDFDAFAKDAADEGARVYVGGPLSRREAWRRFHALTGHWILQSSGWWMVEHDGAGLVGHVGVFTREVSPELEIGWGIHRDHWGKGFAPEAARAALDYAVGPLGARRVIANIALGNTASMKVAEKIGMTRAGHADFYGEPDWRYAFEVA
jgi:RimJ/RimL family protein N-acetyltransferase